METKYFLDKVGLTTLVNKVKELLAGKTDKLETGVSGQVLVDDGNGNIGASGVLVGGEALAETPTVTTLATELAVSTAVATAVGNIETISDDDINALFETTNAD